VNNPLKKRFADLEKDAESVAGFSILSDME